jgi:GrpB-like predicted nucleotidyltransferase (UPF0157 family)
MPIQENRTTKKPVLRQLKPSFQVLGTIASFLTREPPFSEFRAGKLLAAIRFQISHRNHIALLKGETIVGYCGWLPITKTLGEKWMANKGKLGPVPAEAADAVALTIVSCTSREHLLPMIRECRRLQSNRPVYFKRQRKVGISNKVRVFNRSHLVDPGAPKPQNGSDSERYSPPVSATPDSVEEIKIVDYNSSWPSLFEAEAALLRQALDSKLIVALEHFGSTAIPGMPAKPIIDILIGVRSLAIAGPKFIEPLQRLGYVYRKVMPLASGMIFIKGFPRQRTHKLHVHEPGQTMWRRGLGLRDYLRSHPEDARRYALFKADLAQRYRDDRFAYTKEKNKFIMKIEARAKLDQVEGRANGG